MPIARVQLPDGRIGRFEVPVGTSPADIESFISQQMPSQEPIQSIKSVDSTQLESQLASRPSEQTFQQNLRSGLIQGGKSAITGALGLVSDVLGKAFPQSESIQSFRELLPEAIKRSNIQYQAQTGDSLAAGAGNIIGQAAPYLALPTAAATLPARMGLGALSGAVAGATAPSEIIQTPEQALTQRIKSAETGGVVGAVVPAAITGVSKGAPALIQKLANINPTAAKDFLDTGVQTSLGALSDSPAVKLGDKWLSKFVGSAGIMQKNTAKTLDDIQSIVKQTGAGQAVTSQEAGKVIQEGGQNYVNRFQQASNKLYNRLDKYIKPETPISISNSIQALNELATAPSPGLEKIVSSNPAIKYLNNMKSDAERILPADLISMSGPKRANLTYEALKDYRTKIGQELSTPHLIGGTEIPIYKRAYAALTKDMEAAAAAQGQPALNAFRKANDFYSRGITEIEDNLQNIILKKVPEDAYQAAISGTAKGGTRINSIMRSLKPNQREIVRGTVLKQLGLAKPGAQDATGELFSTNTYLTNWNKMSPEAKTAIFRDSETVNSLNKIARISNNIKEVDRFGNPSGTAQQVGVGSVLLGAFINPAVTAGLVGGANVSARLMTNQRFVKWLARASIAKNPQSLGQELVKLKDIARKDPHIANDIASYITTVGIISTRNEDK